MNLNIQRAFDHWLGLTLIHALRLPTYILGLFLNRDHSPNLQGDINIVKIRGGGSLLVALPAILSIKKAYPEKKINIICSKQIVGFAKLLGCFDRYEVVDTDHIPRFVITSIKTIIRNWRCDTVIDLEIHSKLTTVFCLLLAARNRFGFYMGWDQWKGGITTHSLFFNESSPIYLAYSHVARVLGVNKIYEMSEASQYFRQHLGLNKKPVISKEIISIREIGLAAFSSDLCPEREYTPEQWAEVIKNNDEWADQPLRIFIFGGPSDVRKSEIFIERFKRKLNERKNTFEVISKVGKMNLSEVALELDRIGTLLTIDSGLNHIARLLGIEIISYWGPTDPYRLLNPFPGMNEKVYYKKMYCSPCVHATQSPPCKGDNICMQAHLGTENLDDLSLGWLVSKGRITS